MIKHIAILLFMTVFVVSACGTNDGKQPVKSPTPKAISDQQLAFALTALEDNIRDADLTALVEVVNKKAGAPVDYENLVEVQYYAKVLETFSGSATYDWVEYIDYEEADEIDSLEIDDEPFIISLYKNEHDVFHVPDVGYRMPNHPELIAKARLLANLND
ncbi:MAG: hypothetical protein HKM24_07990 [Gammaproteobacteria bacterium]|nr:hypothetical protein [Gammaproteobacteria bacterium]